GGFERFFLFSGPVFAACGFLVAADGGEHGGGLFPAHDGDAGVRPHPQEARRVGAPAHAVVSGAEGAADDDGEFGDAGAGDGGDHFRAVFGDAAGFVVAAHHEPGDVLQEDEGDGAPVAQFDEVGAFERGFGEQDAVVGDDADGVTVQVREPGDEGGPVVGFEFGEFAGVDEPCDDFPHVVGGAGVGGDDAVQFRGVGCGGPGFAHVPGGCGPRAEGGDDAADDGEGVCVVVGDVVDDSGDAGVDVAAAEFFRGDDF